MVWAKRLGLVVVCDVKATGMGCSAVTCHCGLRVNTLVCEPRSSGGGGGNQRGSVSWGVGERW
jgi:hypothetical protein